MDPPGRRARDALTLPAGPENLDFLHRSGLAETEDERKLALGEITRRALHHRALGLSSRGETDAGSDAIAVARRPLQPEPDPGSRSFEIVPIEIGPAAIRRDEEIRISISVDVPVSGPSRDDRPGELGTDLIDHFSKAALA